MICLYLLPSLYFLEEGIHIYSGLRKEIYLEAIPEEHPLSPDKYFKVFFRIVKYLTPGGFQVYVPWINKPPGVKFFKPRKICDIGMAWKS